MTERKIAVGVDVGGTKVNIGLVDSDGNVIGSRKYENDRGPVRAWTQKLIEEIDALCREQGVEKFAGIGFAFRGIIDFKKSRLISSRIIDLNEDYDICKELEAHYGVPSFMDNDVKAATFGEIVFGAGKTQDHFALINIGTGLGMGLVFDGKCFHGNHFFAGEAGYSTSRTYDGEYKQLEELVSGEGIDLETRRLAPKFPDTMIDLSGERISGKDVFEAAAKGDALGRIVVDELIDALAAQIYNMECLLDLGTYVFMGSVASAPNFLKDLEERIQSYVYKEPHRVLAVKPQLSMTAIGANDIGIIGAASVLLAKLPE